MVDRIDLVTRALGPVLRDSQRTSEARALADRLLAVVEEALSDDSPDAVASLEVPQEQRRVSYRQHLENVRNIVLELRDALTLEQPEWPLARAAYAQLSPFAEWRPRTPCAED